MATASVAETTRPSDTKEAPPKVRTTQKINTECLACKTHVKEGTGVFNISCGGKCPMLHSMHSACVSCPGELTGIDYSKWMARAFPAIATVPVVAPSELQRVLSEIQDAKRASFIAMEQPWVISPVVEIDEQQQTEKKAASSKKAPKSASKKAAAGSDSD